MEINWGIIGCGDVTEVKSGPAFNKVAHSKLIAVMRRDTLKAEDYAKRHKVPKFYTDAYELINDPEINAIYIATPPLYHEEYTNAALKAGKPVYVEKPMALSKAACLRMIETSKASETKLVVAHYRRALPMFIKIKELITQIGDIRFVNIQFLQPEKTALVANSEVNWRVDPKISGGGLFHDMAPHHIDLMLHFFGDPVKVSGYSANQAKTSTADDIVSGELIFEKDIICKALWCFNVPENEAKDCCEIIGSLGKVTFPFHGSFCSLYMKDATETFTFQHPQHIEQPMIELATAYFLGNMEENPCDPEVGAKVAGIMDVFSSSSKS